jgi:TfoX/Sxy family transcriptional regulator of competence genes
MAKPKSASGWKSAPAELVRRFERALAAFPRAELRRMFGYPAAFVNGNMMAGLFQESLMVRLSAGDRAKIRDESGAKPFEPVPGRVMREYVIVPVAIVKSEPELRKWLGNAFAYADSLPAKRAKARRTRT